MPPAGLMPLGRLAHRAAPFARELAQIAARQLRIRIAPADQGADVLLNEARIEHGRPGRIRVGVEPHRLPPRRLIDQRQRLDAAAPIGAAGALVVRNHHRHFGTAGGRERFRQART